MKRFMISVALLLSCIINLPLVLAQIDTDFSPPHAVPVTEISDGLWIVEENYPEYIHPQLLVELYDLLQGCTQPVDKNLYIGHGDMSPAVIRFVPPDPDGNFPESTEGYAGMCDRVVWNCIPVPSTTLQATQYCSFESIDEGTQVDHTVRYALVQLPQVLDNKSMRETLGFTIHEMSHLLGTVDGIRCPYNENYSPTAKLPPDPNDSYWWFGVQGVFGLVPDGIVMLAFDDCCVESDDLIICEQLRDLFHQYPICNVDD